MNISGFNKLTLLDYPKHISAIIFTSGCNFRCSFCQNSELLASKKGDFLESDILDYLEKRKNVLDGLVISGGEPTLQKDLISFIRKVKNLGLKVKLDTNGSNPEILKELLDSNLLDYVAMDIKNIECEYEKIIGINKDIVGAIKRSIDLIKNSGIDYEFRTTIMKNFHNEKRIKQICAYLGSDVKYYLQNYQLSDGVLDKTMVPFSKEELISLKENLKMEFPNVTVRGI